MLEHTPRDHRDYELLKQAEAAVHELALCINTAKENRQSEHVQDTLKKLELILMTDVSDVITLLATHLLAVNMHYLCCTV